MKISAARAAKTKEVARILLGDVSEPKTFESLSAGLHFYSANSDLKHSKAWALEWVEKSEPELAKQLHPIKETLFSNRGYICRMLELGTPIDESVIRDLVPFFKKLVIENTEKKAIISPEGTPTYAPPKTKLATEHYTNLAMLSLDAQIDNAINGYPIQKVELGTNKEELLYVEKFITRTLDEFVKLKEAYTPRVIAVLKPMLTSILAEVRSILSTLNKSKLKTATTDKTPMQMIKKVKYQLEDTSLNLKSILLKDIIGKKLCWAYDTESRFLMKFVSTSDGGFWFSGTTLHNIDFEKSTRKIVRKPEEFFSAIPRPLSCDSINTAYESIRAKDLSIRSGQTNENLIFLKV